MNAREAMNSNEW